MNRLLLLPLTALLAACSASTPRQPADADAAAAQRCPKCVEVMTREERGFRDDSYLLDIEKLRSHHDKPGSDHDYKINSYQLLGSVRTIVARDKELAPARADAPALTNRHGQRVPLEIFLSLHRQLKRIFWKRFELAEAEGEALSQNILREALEASGFTLKAFGDAGGIELLKDSEITALVKAAGEKLWKSSELETRFDVPYIAGYAPDNPRFIFIDRNVPKEGRAHGKRIRAHYLLNVHERVEKILLDELELTYQHAHQIAQRSERRAAKADGVSWEEYDKWMEPISEKIGTSKPLRIHPNLDMTCYYSYDDEDNLKLVAEMEEAKRAAR
jgi:hypothetical protein